MTVRLWPLPGRKVSVPTAQKDQKTILIMMSNTGGGHKASAEALQQAFQEKYGDKYKVSQLSTAVDRAHGSMCMSAAVAV